MRTALAALGPVRALALLCMLVAFALGVLLGPGAALAARIELRGFAAPLSSASAGASAARVRAALRAQKARVRGVSLTPSAAQPHWACPEGACDAIVDPSALRVSGRTDRVGRRGHFALPAGGPLLEGSGELGGFDPQDLQSAYDVPSSGGSAQTVALVDAGGYPEAEHDLAVYRERYGLPPCTRANGCFRKVNEKGEERDYPIPAESWEVESSLDIEMVSAACPECHILLVENTEGELAEGDTTAARLGASEISNSWEGACAGASCEAEDADFDHPGVLITVASGDSGYGSGSPDWPASLPDVIAVGGTSLYRAKNARGWSEEAWVDGGSGCSAFPKPSWQTDSACRDRMVADVSADAACETPVSIYLLGQWENVCGTSAASPLVAAIEAHAPEYSRSLPGAQAFYEDPTAFNDVTKGSNGTCSPPAEHAYFCNAGVGYDGPTGVGSPNGPLNLTGAAPPYARTEAPSAISAGGATLNGTVTPFGLETSYRFEYGPTTGYGSDVPVPEGSVGTSLREVAQSVSGLVPKSVYHYRLVATSSAGISYGADETFTTGAPAVSAVSPGGGPPGGGTVVTITGSDFLGATAVSFGSTGAEFSVDSATELTVSAPGGKGTVDVTVTSPAGTSVTSPADRFTYGKPGPVLAWGYNHGLLGDGLTKAADAPVEAHGLGDATAVATGYGQSLALQAGGRLMAWGENLFGTVGNGSFGSVLTPVGVCAVGVGECPSGPYLEEVSGIAAGVTQSLAVLRNGTAVAWGTNGSGQLTGEESSRVPRPVCLVVESPCRPEHYLREVSSVAAGAFFSLALMKNGTVMAWGANEYGALGTGKPRGPESCEGEPCSRVPVPVKGLKGVSAIAAGWAHAYALRQDGEVMAWGEGQEGELGNGTETTSSARPKAVCAVAATFSTKSKCKSYLQDVQAIAGGLTNGYALLANGQVVSWGTNAQDQLGDGSPYIPERCNVEKPSKKLKNPEKVYCSTVPVLVKGITEGEAIAGGPVADNTLVELRSGELESWGSGTGGKLGDGEVSDSATPVLVCQPYSEGPCPDGPYLAGSVEAMAAGSADIAAFASSAAPTVEDVAPQQGPAGGATSVSITGTGFTGASTVRFGGAEAVEAHVESGDLITAVSPPGSGTVDVTVSGPEGTSETNVNDHFTYESPPVLSATLTAYGHETGALSGTVDPEGKPVTSCRFEYGSSPAYGSTVPCSALPGGGTGPVAVSAAVSGLQPDTTYDFRLAATNELGTGYSSRESFTTLAQVPGLPGVGRCVKVAGRASSRYSEAACLTPSAHEDKGRYEWEPPAKNRFTAHPRVEFQWQASGGLADVTCLGEIGRRKESIWSGEYTGPQSLTASIVLQNCSGGDPKSLGECQSPGAGSGEILITALVGELGFIESEIREGKPTAAAGWLLRPASGDTLASFSCESGGPWTVTGSAIGTIRTTDEMTAANTVGFGWLEGHQQPEGFEGAPPSTMSISGEGTEQPSLFSMGEVEAANEEPLEIRVEP